MFNLPQSLKAWNSKSFNSTLNHEVCNLDSTLLPLQQGLQYSSYVIADRLSVIVLSTQEESMFIRVKAGLAYNGIIAGCSCSDDPTPIDETNEYCEVLFSINKKTAEATVKLFS
jgi:hypothetical protein